MRASEFTGWAAGRIWQVTVAQFRSEMLEALKNDPEPVVRIVLSRLPVLSIEFYLDDNNEEVVIKNEKESVQEIVDYLKDVLLKNEIAALP